MAGAAALQARAIAPAVVLRDIVRQAVMAASGHNTQPWKFALRSGSIVVLPDFSRRTPVVDPDDHHLFVSLGCAVENLEHAARPHGFHADVDVRPDWIEATLEAAPAASSPLADAIPVRQCTRSLYDGRPLSVKELLALEAAGRRAGVNLVVMTAKRSLETVLEYVTLANAAQLGDERFAAELRDWIRFNPADAERTRDGLASAATGHRDAPRWLGRLLFGALLSAKRENERAAAQLRSSAGVAVFVSERDERVNWVQVGRAYERFALQATALGIRNAFLNQPVEVPPLRRQLASWLGIGDRRPDLIVRFGRGPMTPPSLRRPIDAVLM